MKIFKSSTRSLQVEWVYDIIVTLTKTKKLKKSAAGDNKSSPDLNIDLNYAHHFIPRQNIRL